MAIGVNKAKGVFCLETDQWFGQKDRATIEPALELLERFAGVRHERRDVATQEEFRFYLAKYFAPGYKTHPVLYLGFHGWRAGTDGDAYVKLGDGTEVTLERLEEWIDGQCRGRLIYFGACGVMDPHGKRLSRFVRRTGAVGVCGYREEIDWLESTVFDTLAIKQLQKAAFTKSSLRKFDRELKETAPGAVQAPGFPPGSEGVSHRTRLGNGSPARTGIGPQSGGGPPYPIVARPRRARATPLVNARPPSRTTRFRFAAPVLAWPTYALRASPMGRRTRRVTAYPSAAVVPSTNRGATLPAAAMLADVAAFRGGLGVVASQPAKHPSARVRRFVRTWRRGW